MLLSLKEHIYKLYYLLWRIWIEPVGVFQNVLYCFKDIIICL